MKGQGMAGRAKGSQSGSMREKDDSTVGREDDTLKINSSV